jgi:DNA polymerase I-like protein with 3'-5' exonuclease and polymerase domains
MQLPLFEPSSDWEPPKRLPVIPGGLDIGIDTETRDDGLNADRGPGWVFAGSGYIAGISVAWNDSTVYVPIRHPDTENFDVSEVRSWIQDIIFRARRCVFHNQSYDQGWLSTENVEIPEGKTDDTQFMAVLLDENQYTYNLDDVCRRYGVQGKDETKLNEAAAAYSIDPKKDLWKMPAKFVGPYAEQDARATLNLRNRLLPEMEREGLMDAYQLEMDLIPMILAMRRRGIRINEDSADQVRDKLNKMRDEVLRELKSDLIWRHDITMEHLNSAKHLEQFFQAEGVDYPRTPQTKVGSFKSDWMKAHDHWLPQRVSRARALNDLANKFIGNYILGATHLGRIHAEIHQLRDDEGGTRSYRFSYSNPPLQQMPSRDGQLAPLIRGVFEPELDCAWDSEDYSQQEPRLAVHFAAVCKVAGYEAAVRYYSENDNADFHTMVSEMTGVPRKKAKIINLGLMYGMGLAKLAASLGVSLEEAEEMVEQYNTRMPFISKLTEFCGNRVNARGYIRLLDGARCRFDLWEPAWGKGAALPLAQANKKYEGKRLKRSGTHKAMNRLVQGSAARQTKLAMRACWKEGYLPLIQMHDELGFSQATERDSLRVREIMRDIVKLRVPMKVDGAFGRNWGEASDESITPLKFEEAILRAA